jgi:ABC-type multidrug transport system ATPase subunit
MEECEALCTRLTIMVGGRMRCIGSLQHLKERFGQGFTAMVKMPPGHATDDVKAFVLRTFPGAELAEEHQGLMNFQIPKVCACLAWPNLPDGIRLVCCTPNRLASQTGQRWSQVFEELEGARTKFGIEDYSVSQTSLEQVRQVQGPP